jgi:hypothetical protein
MWSLHLSPLMKNGPTRSLLDAAGAWGKIFRKKLPPTSNELGPNVEIQKQ